MAYIEKTFDLPIPLRDAREHWKRLQRGRRADVILSPIGNDTTRVSVRGERDAEIEVDRLIDELKKAGGGA